MSGNDTGTSEEVVTIAPEGGGIAVPADCVTGEGGQRVGPLSSPPVPLTLAPSRVLAGLTFPRHSVFRDALFWPRGAFMLLAPARSGADPVPHSAGPAAPRVRDAVPDGPGTHIRTVRKDKGLSRRAVARAAGFTRRELRAFEANRREPSLLDWRCLAGSLGVDLDELAPFDVLMRDAEETHDQRIDGFLRESTTAGSELVLAIEHIDDSVAVGRPSDRSYDGLPGATDDWRAVRARKRVERRWRDLHARVAEVTRSYERVMGAGPADDLHELLTELEQATQRVRTSAAFERSKARHRLALDHYRGGLDAEPATGAGS